MVSRGEFSQLPLHHLRVYSKDHLCKMLIAALPGIGFFTYKEFDFLDFFVPELWDNHR